MSDPNDDILDRLLREHFAAEVDPQLGRAPAAIARSRRRLPWRAVILPLTAAAAALLILLIPAMTPRSTPRSAGLAPTIAPAAETGPVDHVVEWRNIDQGTVFVNGGVPMRSIRRQRLDSYTWTDPASRETMEMTVPHDEIVLIGLPAN